MCFCRAIPNYLPVELRCCQTEQEEGAREKDRGGQTTKGRGWEGRRNVDENKNTETQRKAEQEKEGRGKKNTLACLAMLTATSAMKHWCFASPGYGGGLENAISSCFVLSFKKL